MRLLAADIGNTSTAIGLFDEGGLVGSWHAETDPTVTDDELAATVAGLLALDGHHMTDVTAPRWPAWSRPWFRGGRGCWNGAPASPRW